MNTVLRDVLIYLGCSAAFSGAVVYAGWQRRRMDELNRTSVSRRRDTSAKGSR